MKRRYVIKHLLMLPGISTQAYKQTFGKEAWEDFPILKKWIEQGWLQQTGGGVGPDYIGLTTEGLGLSDYIGPQLISEDIMGKMLEWERANA